MKWHGGMVFTDRTEMVAVSCGISHVSTVSTSLWWILKKCTIKKARHSFRNTCEHSESAREQRIALYLSATLFKRSTATVITIYCCLLEGCRKTPTRDSQRSFWARQDSKLPAHQASHNLPSAMMMMRSLNLSKFLMIGEEIRVTSSWHQLGPNEAISTGPKWGHFNWAKMRPFQLGPNEAISTGPKQG